jgi:hypothetical protein
MNLLNKTEPLSPEYEQKKNLERAYERECGAQEMLEANAFLQKQVSERAAKYKPESPLDELRRLREQARLAMPELMEFVNQALSHIERLIDENERLEGELEEARWISVEDRLPAFPYSMIAITQQYGAVIAHYARDRKHPQCDGWYSRSHAGKLCVTHWMPLPPLPEAKSAPDGYDAYLTDALQAGVIRPLTREQYLCGTPEAPDVRG